MCCQLALVNTIYCKKPRLENTWLKSLYRSGKFSRLLRMQELKGRKCILYRKKKQMYIINKKRTKHNDFCSPYKGQDPRLTVLGNQEISGKSQSSFHNNFFFNTSKKLLKKQKLNFSRSALIHMKTRMPSNILSMIVGNLIISTSRQRLSLNIIDKNGKPRSWPNS